MNTVAVFNELEGRVVNGRFRLAKWLGGTERSCVFATEVGDNPLGKSAIKLIPASAPDAESRLAGWSAAAQLSHPHLMGVADFGRCEIDGNPFIYQVTAHADEILAEILPVRALTADETRSMLGPVLDVLEFLSAQGYVQGRLKPSNVLVAEDQLKLSADCMALEPGQHARLGELGVYDAPELAHGIVTPAADVWGLGMTLVEALTQRPAQWIQSSGKEPILPDAIPEPFAGIARSCLKMNPAERCTLRQIKGLLEPASIAAIPPAETPANPPAAAETRERLNRAVSWRANLIAVAVVAVVVLAALMVRKAEFPRRGETQQNAPGGSAPQASRSVAEKPSPYSQPRSADSTKPAAGKFTSLRGGGAGVVNRVIPDVLEAAQRSIRGHVGVGVRVTVDAAGNVTDAELESPSGSKYFNRVAVDAARQWKFAAGRSGTWKVQFEFRQDGIDAGAMPE